jgi:hypothetical protein
MYADPLMVSHSGHVLRKFRNLARICFHTPNRRSDESRTTASARPLTCYIVDDVTRLNMAYTEYSLIILSHIVLAKSSITLREIF